MYSFECEQCGKRFDELVAYSRRDEVACPACQGPARVLVSSFATKTSSGGGASAPAVSAPRFS